MRPGIPFGERLDLAASTADVSESTPRTHRLSSTGSLVRRRRSLYGWRPLPSWDARLLPALGAVAAVALLVIAGGLYARHAVGSLTAEVAADFRSGQAALEAGKSQLKVAAAAHDLAGIQKSQVEFAAAEADFQAGAAAIDHSRLVGLAGAVPIAGSGFVSPRVQAVDHLAAMGVSLSKAASAAAGLDHDLSAPDPHGLKGAPHLLATLKNATPQLVVIQRLILDARKQAHLVDPALLPSSERAAFGKSLGSIDKAAGAIVEFNRLVPAIFDILGADGPRTYLIEQVNPAELRSGGGFIGTLSVARASGGKLTILETGDSYSLEAGTLLPGGNRPYPGQAGYVAPPPELAAAFPAAYGQGLSWSLVDSDIFADGRTNAQWGEWFSQHWMGRRVDGVIVMDYFAVADLMNVTGPIHLPGFGITFTGPNFVHQVLAQDVAQTSIHKSILSAAAQPLLKSVSSLPAGRWPQLVAALNQAVTQGHLQVFFNNPVSQNEMIRLGWSRIANPAHAQDFFMETEDNYGGSKTNAFLTRTYTVQLTRTAAGVHHKVIVDLTDRAPLDLPSNRSYGALVRFYVGAGATNLHVSANPGANIPFQTIRTSPRDVPLGLKVAGGYATLDITGRTSGHYRVVFEYDTPWNPGANGVESMYWQKQQGTVADALNITWTAGGHTYHATGDLSQDRLVQLSSRGVSIQPGQAASVQLPSISL